MSVDLEIMRNFFDKILGLKKDNVHKKINSDDKHAENKLKSDEEEINEINKCVDIKIEEKNSEKEFGDVTLACIDNQSQTHKFTSQYLDLELEDQSMENQDEYEASIEIKAQYDKVQKKTDKNLGLNFDSKSFDENLHFKFLFPCNVCNKFYSLKDDLSDHIMIRIKEHSNACSLCEKSFSHQSEFKVHKKKEVVKLPIEYYNIKFLKKCCQEGRLLLEKHDQNFIFQVF